MSKKHDFLRSEQNRDKHPERQQAGSPAQRASAGDTSSADADRQAPGTGKVANDHNKTGHQTPTQTNQGKRTPESRHDRQTLAGGPQNQVSARKGGGGAGRSPRGAG
jgi:hypothetical protein